jgi:hypothetical protein
MIYLFGGEESKAKNSKVAPEYAEHREHIAKQEEVLALVLAALKVSVGVLDRQPTEGSTRSR